MDIAPDLLEGVPLELVVGRFGEGNNREEDQGEEDEAQEGYELRDPEGDLVVLIAEGHELGKFCTPCEYPEK